MISIAPARLHEISAVQCTNVSGQVNNCLSLPHNASVFFGVFGVFLIFVFVFSLVCQVKIITKAGYSGWYVLTAFVPILNIVMFLVFAFGKWRVSRLRDSPVCTGGGRPDNRPWRNTAKPISSASRLFRSGGWNEDHLLQLVWEAKSG